MNLQEQRNKQQRRKIVHILTNGNEGEQIALFSSLRHRIPEFEYLIVKPRNVFHYLMHCARRRLPKLENRLLPNLELSVNYAEEFIAGRWPELERALLEAAQRAKESEEQWQYNMKTRPTSIFNRAYHEYISNVIGHMHNYARDVIKGRWSPAEPYIQSLDYAWQRYMDQVIIPFGVGTIGGDTQHGQTNLNQDINILLDII